MIESAATFSYRWMSGGKTMSVCIKSGFLVQILVFLSSCSLIGGLGFGSKDVCADGACETSRILNNPQSPKKWYCYGVAADRSWGGTKVKDLNAVIYLIGNIYIPTSRSNCHTHWEVELAIKISISTPSGNK